MCGSKLGRQLTALYRVLPPSFIAMTSQGIHLVPWVAYHDHLKFFRSPPVGDQLPISKISHALTSSPLWSVNWSAVTIKCSSLWVSRSSRPKPVFLPLKNPFSSSPISRFLKISGLFRLSPNSPHLFNDQTILLRVHLLVWTKLAAKLAWFSFVFLISSLRRTQIRIASVSNPTRESIITNVFTFCLDQWSKTRSCDGSHL